MGVCCTLTSKKLKVSLLKKKMFPPKLEQTAVPGAILWNMGLRPQRGLREDGWGRCSTDGWPTFPELWESGVPGGSPGRAHPYSP